ncbi:MarR family transcriptional regulator [Helicobacter pylori]|uniref:MarR family transcriptional regulator n=1 Tax=Helicobacter pylori TaxID=210 RepID=UPI001EE8F3B4|nr:MarR family transcriptional regulator [Helicobacter pylori]
MKHDTGFIDVSIPYQGYKLSLCLERIEDIGEFTLFCLHAFGDGLKLNELSQVTEIDSMTIQKHLDFLVKWGFVDGKHLAFYNLSHSLACFSSQITSPLA